MKIQHRGLFDDRYGAPGKHNIYECKNCGFGKIHPELSRKKIGQFYKKYYPLPSLTSQKIRKQAKKNNPLKSWIFGTNNVCHTHAKPGEKVLDIGSASGVSLLEIKLLGAKAYGVEPDPTAQQLAKKLKINVFQGFITDNPFPNIKFDLITASQVIEHEPTPKEFLKSIKNKIKPNGRVILSFPNYNGLYKYFFRKKWLNWHVPYHLNFFSKKSFLLLAKQSGFKVKKINTITPNLWTVLQTLMLLKKSDEGVPSIFWKKSNQSFKNKTKKMEAKRNIHSTLLTIFMVLITPINRIIDFLGLGESYVVIIEPNKN